jgi:hypothetical protein
MKSLIQLKKRRVLCLAMSVLACLALTQTAHAVVPPPDGNYPDQNTAEGKDALFSLTTGVRNTAVGFRALYNNTTSDENTAIGSQALLRNTSGTNNTATGAKALLSNTFGGLNTANGAFALFSNTSGNNNTATGINALFSNITGNFNMANGAFALFNNIDGFGNSALGDSALSKNIHGGANTAIGDLALSNNDSTGNDEANLNTAVGAFALTDNINGDSNNAVGAQSLTHNTTGLLNQAFGVLALSSNDDGAANVAVGDSALTDNAHGSFNTVVGDAAGFTAEGDDNIYIGASAADGVTSESGTIRVGDPNFVSTCYIAGISGRTASRGMAVFINANGKLGTTPSSLRFKDDIKPMDKASEAIHALKPVTFRYKKEIDAERTPQFGLVAEDVEKVNPDLVVRDAEGKVYTVRYDAVNAMLLNEFLKEHKMVQDQGVTIAHLQKQIEALTAGLQKVSAQLELDKQAPQLVSDE